MYQMAGDETMARAKTKIRKEFYVSPDNTSYTKEELDTYMENIDKMLEILRTLLGII